MPTCFLGFIPLKQPTKARRHETLVSRCMCAPRNVTGSQF
ncbi:uncharacterized protein CELE_Y38C1BA.4 [Caenorhabditis elegans]|uniref:Uncharacterized protein n=1 Tax=Caenorhabditis elegans TaxID=6239 RepID=D3KZG4_CAEEL|nr:Uncharacterized protein CELE_Y38C1BA.4 [Caenorhabditis elegans]CCD72730.1 Uncharacterized protein CELE_Y38C1BA.4 [Caenorhabditis elegans]|eukprot:NP_001255236.1 Uncharacterized protein CELE_Y38C1BA.4 [Caenorhabditis elegans]